MFKNLVNTTRERILLVLRSAEKNIADDSNFTSGNAFNIARYYMPFMITPTKKFNVKEYEKRVIRQVNLSADKYSDDEKKSIIREISLLTDLLPPSGSVRLYNAVNDLTNTKDMSHHLFAGTIVRAIVFTTTITLITPEPGFFVFPIGILTSAYYFGKIDGLTGDITESLVKKYTESICNILNKNTIQDSTIRLEKEFGLVKPRQASIEAKAENWRYWEKQADEDAVVIFPKNTYDDGKSA